MMVSVGGCPPPYPPQQFHLGRPAAQGQEGQGDAPEGGRGEPRSMRFLPWGAPGGRPPPSARAAIHLWPSRSGRSCLHGRAALTLGLPLRRRLHGPSTSRVTASLGRPGENWARQGSRKAQGLSQGEPLEPWGDIGEQGGRSRWRMRGLVGRGEDMGSSWDRKGWGGQAWLGRSTQVWGEQ